MVVLVVLANITRRHNRRPRTASSCGKLPRLLLRFDKIRRFKHARARTIFNNYNFPWTFVHAGPHSRHTRFFEYLEILLPLPHF